MNPPRTEENEESESDAKKEVHENAKRTRNMNSPEWLENEDAIHRERSIHR